MLGLPRRARTSIWLAGLLLSCLSLIGNIFTGTTSRFLPLRNSFVGAVNEGSESYQKDKNNGGISVETNLISHAKNETPIFPRICSNGPLLEPIWEWHFFGKNSTNLSNQRKRLLIASYSAFGGYAKLLELTSPINKAYAKLWNHDIVVLQGTTMILPWDENCMPPEERSRFNKIDLLLEALNKKDQYDQLLLLDADTLIYDFSFDITQLVSDTTMLVAQRTHKEDLTSTTNLNNGVTLWNLHHPLTAEVADDWNKACREGIPDNRPYRGDQFYLRQILGTDDRIASISSVWEEFYYRDGTVIKHFQRSNARSWNETGLDSREEKILNATRDICNRFQIHARDLDHRNYTTITTANVSTQNEICVPRRKSVWDILAFAKNHTTPASKRLLIAQYSSFGSYASLLEATAPINKAYARKWNHDILILQGTALILDMDRKECEPPQHRSMYNKIPLLIYALGKKERYDQVLILDADTIIYDFVYDITTLLDEDDMLAAHRVNLNDTARTWNINDGITLWNLRHNLTQKVAKQWLKRTSKGLNGAHNFGWKEHGDQYYLHKTLRGQMGAIQVTRALADEFRYEIGTVAKHFVRPKNNDWSGYGKEGREAKIQSVIESICTNFSSDCIDLERLPYSTI